jgi:glycosyltransferase involved in cell wall biosynthesis
MQSGVPVITSNTSGMLEIGDDAVLFADPNDPSQIAEQMKLIFKDEQLRTKMIEKGKLKAQKFNWDETASKMWQLVTQAITK